MVPKIITGRGVTGALRYVLGEGRTAPGAGPGRVAWLGGQGFGWDIAGLDDAELARRVMEAAALRQASRTRPCVKDCVHLVLNWRRGEEPGRAEMEEAAHQALAALGMGGALAVWAAHRDTGHAHLHIVASRIDPATGRAFGLRGDWRKLSRWARAWEAAHGGIQCRGRPGWRKAGWAKAARQAAERQPARGRPGRPITVAVIGSPACTARARVAGRGGCSQPSRPARLSPAAARGWMALASRPGEEGPLRPAAPIRAAAGDELAELFDELTRTSDPHIRRWLLRRIRELLCAPHP